MALLIATGPVFANNEILYLIEVACIALGIWAIVIMKRKSKFSGLPEPKENAHLLETGPYHYIRNPMYSAVIVGFGSLLLDFFTPFRLLIYILEIIVLLKKISIEEKLLTEKFKDYPSYKSRTKKLIPFIY